MSASGRRWLGGLWLVSAFGATAQIPAPDFARDVAPILKTCVACHGAALQQSGLRLDSRRAALDGGYRGAAIKPGDSAGSLLIQMVAGKIKGVVMPPAGEKLTPQQIGVLRAWIDAGAVWPEQQQDATDRKRAVKHWAFMPSRRPVVPQVNSSAWVRGPIDAFILARLKKEGISPSPEASRETIIRRVSLDLTGLPPTPDEIGAFVSDSRPDAYERLVDRLLASVHFGEKWARHWLDLARYADSDGYDTDQLRPYAWRFRDWVVNAFNRDIPFDQFTVEQIAGDLLPRATTEQKMATGFHRNTLSNREGGADLEEYRVEQVIDRVSTVGVTWLALGLGCARCHDHKYDPITQKEFYQLYAFFNSADEVNIDAPVPGELGTYLRRQKDYETKRKEILAPVFDQARELEQLWEKKLLEAVANPTKDHHWDRAWEVLGLVWGGNLGWGQLEGLSIVTTPAAERTARQQERLFDYFLKNGALVDKEKFKELKFAEISKKLEELRKEYPSITEAPTIMESTAPRKTHVQVRGDFRNPGVEVQRATPAALHSMRTDGDPSRLTLARWLVSPDNPLTARVQTNRIWQELFGRGIVSTSEDFGTQGAQPTHPELLDWLATEFIRGGWSQKRVIREIVLSSTYRQSSRARSELIARDPNNEWLARQNRIRLPAEMVRDVVLSASGLLCRNVGGPSVRPPQPSKVADEGYSNKWVESQGVDRYRRGLYTWIQRTSPFAQSVIFDAAEASRTCSRRERSNTPLQALTLLNDPVFFEAAQALAVRLMQEGQGGVTDRIDFGFRLSTGRPPSPGEKDRLARYFAEQRSMIEEEATAARMAPFRVDGVQPLDVAAYVALSSVMLNFDPTITRE